MIWILFIVGSAVAYPLTVHELDHFAIKLFSNISSKSSPAPIPADNWLTVHDIYEGPIIIVTSSTETPSEPLKHEGSTVEAPPSGKKLAMQMTFKAYYVENGIKSVPDNFPKLFQHIRQTPGICWLILDSIDKFSNMLLRNNIKDLIVPEKFRVVDLLRKRQYPDVPVVYIRRSETFKIDRPIWSVDWLYISKYGIYPYLYPWRQIKSNDFYRRFRFHFPRDIPRLTWHLYTRIQSQSPLIGHLPETTIDVDFPECSTIDF